MMAMAAVIIQANNGLLGVGLAMAECSASASVLPVFFFLLLFQLARDPMPGKQWVIIPFNFSNLDKRRMCWLQ